MSDQKKVEIGYCPRCDRARRHHLVKKTKCPDCGEMLKDVMVTRSDYVKLWMPMLAVGLFLIFVSLALLGMAVVNESNPVVALGGFLAGFLVMVMSLMYQILDNRQMEEAAKMEMAKGVKVEGVRSKRRSSPRDDRRAKYLRYLNEGKITETEYIALMGERPAGSSKRPSRKSDRKKDI